MYKILIYPFYSSVYVSILYILYVSTVSELNKTQCRIRFGKNGSPIMTKDVFLHFIKPRSANLALSLSSYPNIQQTKMLVTCQRFGDLFLIGLMWQYSSITKHIPYFLKESPRTLKDLTSSDGDTI